VQKPSGLDGHVLVTDVIDQGSISSTFCEQLLCAQIPKAQNDTDNLTVFLRFLGSAGKQAVCDMLVISTLNRSCDDSTFSILALKTENCIRHLDLIL